MAKVFVVAEHRDGHLKQACLELVAAAVSGGNDTQAILLGPAGHEAALVQELASYGAGRVLVAEHATLHRYTSEAFAHAVTEIIRTGSPDIVLAGHTPTGREFMPRVAARLGVGLASDCVELAFAGTSIQVRRPVYCGKATAAVEFLGPGPRLATIRPNALGLPAPVAGRKAEVQPITLSFPEAKTRLVEIVKGQSARPDVTEATVVVSGGRSLKSAENFKLLEELADVLGAAVGASRAAVDAGFRPHRDQVGQTGKVVSPSLYIACGISGAIQHLAGMRTSKMIVAINTDAEAPIFQIADYGVVGDLFQVVPALTDEMRKLKA
jgi:electron transfer flavoprotein alpha subunit